MLSSELVRKEEPSGDHFTPFRKLFLMLLVLLGLGLGFIVVAAADDVDLCGYRNCWKK